MKITQEQFNFLSNRYMNCIQDLLRQNMRFFKFRKQPVWGFMFDERISILGVTNKESNTVALNLAAIDFAFQSEQQLMIEQFALHEFRHLYQYGEIENYNSGNYDGAENIDKVKRWAYEHEHYIGPENNGNNSVQEYYDQDLEFDAFTFAYAAMQFKYNSLPNYIKMPEYYIGKFEAYADKLQEMFKTQFRELLRQSLNITVFAYSKRLVLTSISENDKEIIVDLCKRANPDSADTAVYENISKMEKAGQLDINIDDILWKEIISDNDLNCVIREPYSNIIYGKIVLQGYKKELPELGVDIFPEYQNHGIAPEAIKLFLQYCASHHNIQEVKIRIRKDNMHSNHVFQKLGARYQYDESFFNQAALSMLKNELKGSDLSGFEDKTINVYYLSINDIS